MKMMKYILEMLQGESGRQSSLRWMSWAVLIAIFVSWFVFPDRSVAELAALFGALIGVSLGGKMSYNKHKGIENENSNNSAKNAS